MLHAALADAIRSRMTVENGVDPLKDFPHKSMDTWLCEQGWVKVHNNHILYDGYIRTAYTKKSPIPISDEQLEAISKYEKYNDIHNGGEATEREENLLMKYSEQLERLESVLSSIDDILK